MSSEMFGKYSAVFLRKISAVKYSHEISEEIVYSARLFVMPNYCLWSFRTIT